MGLGDKFEHKAEEMKGKAKEGIGEATDNERLEAEGKVEQGQAKFKQGVDDVKDSAAEAFNDATDRR